MPRSSLPLVALALALLATIVWFAFGSSSKEDAPERPALSAGMEATEADAKTESAAALPEAPVAAESTVADAEPDPAPTARVEVAPLETTSESFAIPEDAYWIEGQVLLPNDTPFEERLRVEARGRRFGKDRDAPRSHHSEVDTNGNFRVAFSEATKKGWLSLEGTFLYLPEKVKVEPATHEGTITLEPRVGGRVIGRAHLPEGVELDETSFEGARATANSWDGEDSISRGVDINADGSFTLDALPVAHNYQIAIECPRFAPHRVAEQVVQRGEQLELDLHFRLGVRISGQVTDESGEAIHKAKLGIKITVVNDNSTHARMDTLLLDDEGRFEKQGIEAGSILLTLHAPGRKETFLDLGKLEDGEERTGLKLQPTLGSFVAGFVQWSDGKPVVAADVLVKQASPSGDFDWESREFRAKTDELGAFRIDGLEERPLIVEANTRKAREGQDRNAKRRKGARVTARIEKAQPGTSGLLLRLMENSNLEGVVVDDLNAPVSRFSLQAEPLREGYDEQRRRHERVDRNFSEEDGRFSLSGLSPGRWQLRAKAREGGSSEWQECEIPGTAVLEFVTPRSATLRGRVQTAAGQVLAGALVQVEAITSPGVRYLNYENHQKAFTDEAGLFQFTGVDPGAYSLSAKADDWADSAAVTVSATPGGTHEDLILIVRTPATLTGEIHPNAGVIANRRVICWSESFQETVTSDKSGNFEFTRLPPGTHQVILLPTSGLNLEAPAASAHDEYTRVELSEGQNTHIVIGAPPESPILIEGRVTQGGRPLAGAQVLCRNGTFKATTISNSDGHYELQGNGAGSYTFTIGDSTENSCIFGEAIGDEERQRVDFELPGTSLGGIIVDATGQPLKDVQVMLDWIDIDPEHPFAKHRQARSDDSGRFEAKWLFPGEYTLRVGWAGYWGQQGSGHAIRILENVQVEAGKSRNDLRIQLDPEARVTVIVSLADGSPAVEASIYMKDAQGRELSPYGMGHTDGNGRAECSSVPAGEIQVRASLEGQPAASGSLRCIAGEGSEIRLILPGP